MVLINVSRGSTVDEKSLLASLETGQVGHAVLDVFNIEPLPAEHPFWQHEQITITPHCSALSNVDTVTEQLSENYLRMLAGKPLLNVVNRELGY